MKTKIISLFLVVLMLAACMAACTKQSDANPVLLTVSGKDVSYDLCRYFYCNYAESYGSDDLEKSDGEIKEQVIHAIKELYAPILLWEELGYSLDDKVLKDYVDSYVDDVIEKTYSGKKSQYTSALKANYLTEEIFEFLIGAERVCDLLYEEYVAGEGAAAGVIDSDPDAIDRAINGENFIRIVQILIRTDYGESEETNRTLAKNLAARAQSGEDFDSLISLYSDDYTMTPDGYYITKYQLSKEFEDVAFSLDVGQVSDVVESNGSFHIFKRLKKDDTYIKENYSSLTSLYFSSCVSKIVEEKVESLSVIQTAAFSECNFSE